MDTLQKYEELRNKTVPGLLFERARSTPGGVAYRAKKRGIYRERTWEEFARTVSVCAMGLKELGIGAGKRVALIGDPCEEYVICEVGAQALGAVTYGIYPTSSQRELLYLMEDGEATLVVAENQEYLDRLLPLLEQLPQVRHVVVIDVRGMFMYENSAIVSFADLMETGEAVMGSDTSLVEGMVDRIKPTDDLFIVYTSGTTGDPKGARMSHGKHLAAAYTLVDRYPILGEMPHRTVVYLPLCHVLGKDVAVTLPLMTEIVPHYGEQIEDLAQTIFETAPTILFSVPRYLQKFASNILVGIETSSPAKQIAYKCAARIGKRHIKNVWDSQNDFPSKLLYWLSYQVAFRPILNKIGFDELKLTLCSGASLPPEVMALWQMFGLNLSEFYGQTETGGGIIAAQSDWFPRPGDVGYPPTGWELAFGDKDEILVRSNDVFEGYWKNPEKTAGVLDGDGWLHTGDVGELTPDGRLKIVDRVRDIIVTSGGKTISPTYIENTLRASPYISEVVAFGHKRKYVTALVEIDYDTVAAWARKKDITYAGFTTLAENPLVLDLIGSEIERLNRDLARVEQVKTFRVLRKELDPEAEDEPVTPTRKVKRGLMYEKFKDLVEAMYSSREEDRLASQIGNLLD